MGIKSRTYNSISNSMWGIASAIITVILNFVVRIIIVKALGPEINGLHNLFQNTINVMALMETSIGSAMIIHLYAPVREKNEELIIKLVAYYRKLYLGIAFAFLLVGIMVNALFLESIVSTSISMRAVHLYFVVFTLSFFANYISYYKRCILYAEQNNRISIIATTASQIVFRGAAIASAVITHEYLYFLLFLILEKILGNTICNMYVNKKHPYLRRLKGHNLEKNRKKSLFNTIKPLIVNQSALTVQNSANSILISMLLGNISIVGYYGNYQLVISTVQLLFSQIGGAFTTSFGNLATEKDKDHMLEAYRKSCFIMNSMAFILCAGFVACIQDFIEFVFGPTFVLSLPSVIILVFGMMIYLLNIPIISVQNAMGLHSSDSKMMVIQAITAIALGYCGGLHFGMEGILLGLTIPTVVFTLIYKGVVMSRIAFTLSPKEYIANISGELLKGCGIIAIVIIISTVISTDYLLTNILVKGVVSILVSCCVIAALSFKNPYFKSTIELIKRIIKHRMV